MEPVSLVTSQLVIAGTNSCGTRTLRCRPAQSCASVSTGSAPGGLTSRDAAKDSVFMMCVCRNQIKQDLEFLWGAREVASGGFGGSVQGMCEMLLCHLYGLVRRSSTLEET